MNEVRATRGLELEWSGIRMDGLMALVTDLSHLENNLGGIELRGIIGFNVLKKFQMHFDYVNQEITLLALDSAGKPLENPFKTSPEQAVAFEFAGHIPVFPVQIGDLELQMGLDSGAAGPDDIHPAQGFTGKSVRIHRNQRFERCRFECSTGRRGQDSCYNDQARWTTLT